ncbi:hypothetical protein [Parvicella tangerina]|uniref:Uncharacterized protein n=1 Tax=Parvicella tangerina TaxID=2829795 RepID=A0A916JL27_9FLAO|nr:hypothetical protein [Parvicella tangerina]CAG5079409.1 hypothetical protein CRYO30217_00937 [Parvicella tangerina]
MKFPSFSKINKHRKFHYTPMYYDPEKEELDERVKMAKIKYGIEEGDETLKRKIRMQDQFKESKSAMDSMKRWNSSIRLFVILGIIIYLAYIVFANLDGFLGKIL